MTSATRSAAATEVACWAHVRRNFHDYHVGTNSPIALEAMTRIGRLFEIERLIHGQGPDDRRTARQDLAQPVMADLALSSTARWRRSLARATSPRRSATPARAGQRSRATSTTADWRSPTTPPSAPSAPLKLGAKNYLFAGSDAGGERAAAIYTLVETAKLNGLDPAAYLRNILSVIAAHPINCIGDLLPWNRSADARPVAQGEATLRGAPRSA